MSDTEFLAEAERLSSAASPGPWAEDDGNVFSKPLSGKRDKALRDWADGKGGAHPDEPGRRNPLGWICSTEQDGENFQNDADFIAFARTALPRLVAMVKERDARLAALDTAVRAGLTCECRWCSDCIETLSQAVDP